MQREESPNDKEVRDLDLNSSAYATGAEPELEAGDAPLGKVTGEYWRDRALSEPLVDDHRIKQPKPPTTLLSLRVDLRLFPMAIR